MVGVSQVASEGDLGRGMRLDLLSDRLEPMPLPSRAAQSSRPHRQHDQRRDRYLAELGYHVVRIPGYEVLQNPVAVRRQIEQAIDVRAPRFVREVGCIDFADLTRMLRNSFLGFSDHFQRSVRRTGHPRSVSSTSCADPIGRRGWSSFRGVRSRPAEFA